MAAPSKNLEFEIISEFYVDDRNYLNGNVNSHKVEFNNKVSTNGKYNEWIKDILLYIEKNIDMNKIDFIITVSFPFFTLEVGHQLKKLYPNTKWFIYELDPYTHNHLFSNYHLLFLRRLIKEYKYFYKSDKILLTHELYDTYNQYFLFDRIKFKFENIGIPLLKIEDIDKSPSPIKKNEPFNIVYTGSIYIKYRNPNYFLRAFALIKEKIPFKIHMFGPSEEEIDSEIKLLLGNSLIIHGRVSKEDVNSFINQADVLVNIGNALNNQLPSKVLEYIGTGKPIINFYSIEDDTSNKYLKKYPEKILINVNDNFEDTTLKIINFLNGLYSNEVNLKNLKKDYEYYLKETVIQRFYESLE